MGRRPFIYEARILTLKGYIEEKLSMLERDFLIQLSDDEKEHMRALKTEISVDNYARSIIKSKL